MSIPHPVLATAEGRRLAEVAQGVPWRRWGPYLGERQWGTVREDYSPDGDAWRSFPHDHARSRAYRWGEDGLAGFCDEQQRWCLGLALWNGRDPILKERLFGLANGEGNHGEDVKEVFHYADATPTHSYNRFVYRYPLAAFPYADLIAGNARRGRHDPEYELPDTGVLDEGAYVDVTVEYAKAGPDDVLMRVSLRNASAGPARLHVLPHLWARNTWSWAGGGERPSAGRTSDEAASAERACIRPAPDGSVVAERPEMPPRRLSVDPPAPWLFTENDTDRPRLFGTPAPGPFKDGIGRFVVEGAGGTLAASGSKAAAHAVLELPPGGEAALRLRFRPAADDAAPFADFDAVLDRRREEADAFFAALGGGIDDPDARAVHRQAIAGLLWSKQTYIFDVPTWLAGDPVNPPPPASRRRGRNADWEHLSTSDVLLMPDKWEYPWFAAWDFAFHCVAMAPVDAGFAKDQMLLLMRAWYMHPNGQLPAYEWNFGDVNPPVHAWAAFRIYEIDRDATGVADTGFLERALHKLILNFTWWVNQKDAGGRNIFQGGFLGLDNIGPFNRSEPVPAGGIIDQADGTAWMAMYALNLLRIALELALVNPVYEDIATKFFEHFMTIAGAMASIGADGVSLWDEADGFFYDTLRQPDGHHVPLRLRSMVGLIPIFAVEVLDREIFDRLPVFTRRLRWFLRYKPGSAALVSRWNEEGEGERHLLSLLRGSRLKKLLRRALDETEFLSDHGVRSLSKAHAAAPFVLERGGARYTVEYAPGESTSGLFGGNSNWRGPIWMPLNFLLIDALRRFDRYYGPEFRVECPVGSGLRLDLGEVADELARRLAGLFLRGPDGRRPAVDAAAARGGAVEGHLLFHEYFHGDTGQGLGASHQTGWTALVANLLASPPR